MAKTTAVDQLPLLTKRCRRCKEEKALDAFAKCRPAEDGLQSWCRECHALNHKKRMRDPEYHAAHLRRSRKSYWANREYYLKAHKKFIEENPTYNNDYYLATRDKVLESSRERQIRKNWGMSPEEYDAIIERGCAICGLKHDPNRKNKHLDKLCLDHNHANGEIRDALCSPCNLALGNMKDDPKRLRAAADYLERHGE